MLVAPTVISLVVFPVSVVIRIAGVAKAIPVVMAVVVVRFHVLMGDSKLSSGTKKYLNQERCQHVKLDKGREIFVST